jgi:ribosomal protein S27AE
MKSYFFKRPELDDTQTPAAFMARRRLIFVPLVTLTVTLLINLIADIKTLPKAYEFLHGAIFFATALLVIYTYRCPRCGDPPKSHQGGTSGILIFPRKCSKCGAPLMPNHKWAQD